MKTPQYTIVRTPAFERESIMKQSPSLQAKSMLGRVISLLGMSVFSIGLAVHGAEDAKDIANSKDIRGIREHIANTSDVGELIKSTKEIKDIGFNPEGLLEAFEILKAEDAEKFKASLIESVKSGNESRFSAIYLLACQPKPDDKSVDALIHAAIHEKDEHVRQLIFLIMTGERKYFESFLNVPTKIVGVKDAKDKLIAAIPKFEKSVDPDNSSAFAEVCRLFSLIDHPEATAALIRLANANHKNSSSAKNALYMNTQAAARAYFADKIKNKEVPAEDRISYLNALNLEMYNGKLETALPKEIADAVMTVVGNEKDETVEVRNQAILKASNVGLPVIDYVVEAIKTTKDLDFKRQLITTLQFQQNETALLFLKELIGKEKDAKERWVMIQTAYHQAIWMKNGMKELAAIYEVVANDESKWLRAGFIDAFGTHRNGSEVLPPYFAWLKKESDAGIRKNLVGKLIYSYLQEGQDYPFIANELLHVLENDDTAEVRQTAAAILNGLFITASKRFKLADPQPSIVRINALIEKATDEKTKGYLIEVRDQWANPVK